jgi:hypothetical protein
MRTSAPTTQLKGDANFIYSPFSLLFVYHFPLNLNYHKTLKSLLHHLPVSGFYKFTSTRPAIKLKFSNLTWNIFFFFLSSFSCSAVWCGQNNGIFCIFFIHKIFLLCCGQIASLVFILKPCVYCKYEDGKRKGVIKGFEELRCGGLEVFAFYDEALVSWLLKRWLNVQMERNKA